MPDNASSSEEEESIFAYACSVKSSEDDTANINVQISSEVEEEENSKPKKEDNNTLSVPEAQNLDQRAASEKAVPAAEAAEAAAAAAVEGEDHEEYLDSFAEYDESRDRVSARESCYGAIQEHLVRLEDRQRRLSNCMTPLSMIMAAEADEEGKSKSLFLFAVPGRRPRKKKTLARPTRIFHFGRFFFFSLLKPCKISHFLPKSKKIWLKIFENN